MASCRVMFETAAALTENKMNIIKIEDAVSQGLVVPRAEGNKTESDKEAKFRRVSQWLRNTELPIAERMASTIPDGMVIESKTSKGYPLFAVYRPANVVKFECPKNPIDYNEGIQPGDFIRIGRRVSGQ